MKKVLRLFIALLGLGVGCGIVAIVIYSFRFPGYEYVMRYTTMSEVLIALYVIVGFVSGLIFYILSPRIIEGIDGFFRSVDRKFTEMPALDILFGAMGILIGMLAAFLLSFLVNKIQNQTASTVISMILYFLLGYTGCRIAVTRGSEIVEGGRHRKLAGKSTGACPKVLDTSVIIDGRILDICKTGFIEGQLVVPAFVLKELRHIADSADALKRSRGRRGLDILKEMQRELSNEIVVEERDYEDVDEVDVKLLRLALDLNGVLMTNDYNLNKVAAVQNMRVLNINDLANAIRPILLPGEELTLQIVKEGKEQGQGIGYLPDGTMVIIEAGKKRIGETVDLSVTSSLQTSAGRMIFARIRS